MDQNHNKTENEVQQTAAENTAYQPEQQPFSALLGIQVLSADENSAFGQLAYRKELTDLLGHMTGGAYNALSDAVAGACARANGCTYVTQNCSM